MSEASKRVLTWREQKREEGYSPVTMWVLNPVKNAMVNDASQLRRDLGPLVSEVYMANRPTKGGKVAALLDRRQVEALVKEQVAQALASQHPVPAAPLPPVLVPPEGKKVCGKGHDPYPANKAECPTCARNRQRAYTQRKALARRGEIPA